MGCKLGANVGLAVGSKLGITVGLSVGANVGLSVGLNVGSSSTTKKVMSAFFDCLTDSLSK